MQVPCRTSCLQQLSGLPLSWLGALISMLALTRVRLRKLLLELRPSTPPRARRYLLPGGSAAHFKREGYTFDVGSSMMFGMGEWGSLCIWKAGIVHSECG